LSLLEQKELEHERSMGAIVALTEKAEELEKRLACSVSSDTELGTLVLLFNFFFSPVLYLCHLIGKTSPSSGGTPAAIGRFHAEALLSASREGLSFALG
jgi:hypothetical protein